MSNKLCFDGSLWINVDMALRSVDRIYTRATDPLGLTVVEWYLLRTLYEEDGQHASELARAIGRAPTSFTPILDKLEQKNLIERRPDPTDRRAIFVYLTDKGHSLRKEVQTNVKKTESQVQSLVSPEDWKAFQNVLARLQSLTAEEVETVR